MGKRKIEIARIEDYNKRHVCFSKRRGGLFKKASELTTLCNAEVAVLVFSSAGNSFVFSSPSNPEAVIRRYLAGFPDLPNAAEAEQLPGSAVSNHAMQLTDKESCVVAEEKKTQLGETLEQINVEAINDLYELEQLNKRLNETRELLLAQAKKQSPSEPSAPEAVASSSEEFNIGQETEKFASLMNLLLEEDYDNPMFFWNNNEDPMQAMVVHSQQSSLPPTTDFAFFDELPHLY